MSYKLENWKIAFGHLKVIVRSNENEPFQVGELRDFTKFNEKHSNEFPEVLIDDHFFICMGVVVPYSDVLAKLLESLSYKEQWNLLRDISTAIQIAH